MKLQMKSQMKQQKHNMSDISVKHNQLYQALDT